MTLAVETVTLTQFWVLAAAVAFVTAMTVWYALAKPVIDELTDRAEMAEHALDERLKAEEDALRDVRVIPTRDDWEDISDFLPPARKEQT